MIQRHSWVRNVSRQDRFCPMDAFSKLGMAGALPAPAPPAGARGSPLPWPIQDFLRQGFPPLSLVSRRGAAWAALAFGLGVTAVAGTLTWRQVEARDEARFESAVEALQWAVVERMESHRQVLRGASGLFAANPVVDGDAWRSYFDRLDLSGRDRGLSAIGYIENVSPTASGAGASGGAGSDGERWGERVSRYIVRHFEPLTPGEQGLGFEPAREVGWLRAAREAADTGKTTLTRKIGLARFWPGAIPERFPAAGGRPGQPDDRRPAPARAGFAFLE